MKRLPTIILILVLTSLTMMSISSCYRDSSNHDKDQHDAVTEDYTAEQLDSIDSISFYSSHHYTEGFNFKVYADSLFLLQQQPEEIVSDMSIDSFPIYKDHQVVVGDIRIIPQDSIDSVWVQLATDEGRWGWIHETQLLPRVVPDDPISEFIMIFSNNHIIISLIIVAIIAIAYIARTVYRKNAPIVHLRDIPSFYPTLLCLTVATAATFYASLQMFAPDTWRNFYYHPSLNPFKMPFILSIFMSSVWTTVHRRCGRRPPTSELYRDGTLQCRTDRCVRSKLYCVQPFHFILHRIPTPHSIFLLCHHSLHALCTQQIYMRQLWQADTPQR